MESLERKWVAIMFCDIQGYTALMQNDENNAAILLRYFQKILNESVARFEGKVVNFYGDGALCVFQLPIHALRCSIVMQNAFDTQKGADNLDIPVRIGLHYGNVSFEQDNAFGHSVNVTSRIESMGVPGAILLSKTVRDMLPDHQDLHYISLGEFEFKNIKDPLEVFALANKGFSLPKRTDLKGKFKERVQEEMLPDKSIAVLAFENRSGDPKDEYFSDGISEEIIFALSQLGQMKVVGKVSSFSFKGKNLESSEIGRQLKVQNLLIGSVQKRGNRVRVTSQLINAQNGFQIWTERFDREMEDIFQIQEDIAQSIVDKMELTLLKSGKKASLINRQTSNLEAYQLYLRGRQYLDQRSSFNLSLSCYEKAIEIDPKYALAWSGISYVYFYQVLFDFKPPQLFMKAQEAANKAMKIDPNLAEAYIIDGIVYFYYYWDPGQAMNQYQKSYELDPNYDIIRIMAYYHSMMCHHDEAERMARKAVELDPLNLGALLGLGEILYRGERFQEAITVLEELLDHFPGNKVAKSLLGSSYYHGGFKEKTESYYNRPDVDQPITLFYSLPYYSYLLEKGMKHKVLDFLPSIEKEEGNKWISPACKAMLYFGLGQIKKAEDLLNLALTERDPILMIIDSEPTWKAFREHPRIQQIRKDRFIMR